VLIVARGGGSAEDLAAFNDERVARAVFACRIPVISAVGHETDWTIIDLVADLRAPTPSAAAELCSPSIESLLEECAAARERAAAAMRLYFRDWRDAIEREERMLDRVTPESKLRQFREEIARLSAATGLVQNTILPERRASFSKAKQSLTLLARSSMVGSRAEVDRLSAVMNALDPINVLRRGYAALESSETGELITTTAGVDVGKRIIARLGDGRIWASVERVDGNQGVRHNAGS
jgi:exodeoxyribonuclease VII large subunit